MNFRQQGIVALGHVLVDGIGEATEAFSKRYSRLSSPAHVKPGQMEILCSALSEEKELLKRPLSWSPGGGILVMAKAALALGLGAEVWGSVGEDERGQILRNEMTKAGAIVNFRRSDLPTGVFCALSLPAGGKKIIVSPGAARDIRKTDLPQEAFFEGWVFYVDGLLIDSPGWLASQVSKAKSRGMLVAMDISTPDNARRHAPTLLDFAESYCDLVFSNEAEFAAFGDIGSRIASARPIWVVKKGSKGASAYSKDGRAHAPAVAAAVIDDTGAGDSFSAGFLLGHMEGLELESCLRRGNAVAAAAIGFRGSNFESAALSRAYEDERHATNDNNAI